MLVLYLVVRLAANTKYSVNSLFLPVPPVAFWRLENGAKILRGVTVLDGATPWLCVQFSLGEPGSLPPVQSPPQHLEH